jgi:hypothetical protein
MMRISIRGHFDLEPGSGIRLKHPRAATLVAWLSKNRNGSC